LADVSGIELSDSRHGTPIASCFTNPFPFEKKRSGCQQTVRVWEKRIPAETLSVPGQDNGISADNLSDPELEKPLPADTLSLTR